MGREGNGKKWITEREKRRRSEKEGEKEMKARKGKETGKVGLIVMAAQ